MSLGKGRGATEGADLNCLVFSAEMSATFKFNAGSLLLLPFCRCRFLCLVRFSVCVRRRRGVISFAGSFCTENLVLIAQFPCGLV